MKEIKAIIFDLWETLGTKNIEISSTLRNHFNIEKTPDFLARYEKAIQLKKWPNQEKMAKSFLKEFNILIKDENISFVINTLQQGINKATLFNGIKNLLTSLKGKHKLGLISNTTVFEAIVLDNLDIKDVFDAVTFSWEVGDKKPSKKMFDITLDKLKISPEEAIFIDDSQKNIDAAKEIGMNTIRFESVDKLIKEIKQN